MYIGLITCMLLAVASIQLAALSTDQSDMLNLSSESQLLQIARTFADVTVACNVYNKGKNKEYDTKMAQANASLVTVSEELMDHLVGKCTEFNYPSLTGTKRRKKAVIFPGTKWCGIGSKAKDDSDLGEYKETDKCCRAHDKCDIYINAFETKYNLVNFALYSVLSCQCNEKFRDCLVTAAKAPTTTDNDKWTANTVGRLYFNHISPKCLQLVYPTICIKWSWWGTCKEYSLDTTQPKVWEFKTNYLFYSS